MILGANQQTLICFYLAKVGVQIEAEGRVCGSVSSVGVASSLRREMKILGDHHPDFWMFNRATGHFSMSELTAHCIRFQLVRGINVNMWEMSIRFFHVIRADPLSWRNRGEINWEDWIYE